jgi:hypothetical protein
VMEQIYIVLFYTFDYSQGTLTHLLLCRDRVHHTTGSARGLINSRTVSSLRSLALPIIFLDIGFGSTAHFFTYW